jgi:hypothetical protein
VALAFLLDTRLPARRLSTQSKPAIPISGQKQHKNKWKGGKNSEHNSSLNQSQRKPQKPVC